MNTLLSKYNGQSNYITQTKDGILEISILIDKNCEFIENRFFSRQPNLRTMHNTEFSNTVDSVAVTSRIWLYPNYSVALRSKGEECVVAISKRRN